MNLDPTKEKRVCGEIAKALGASSVAVIIVYPKLFQALAKKGLSDKWPVIIALATVGVENPSFHPVREKGSKGYFVKHYWENEHVRKMLGNIQESDAWTYCGRGLIQLTGRHNYDHYGKSIKVDLLRYPDMALDPNLGCQIFANYFAEHGLGEWSRKAGEAASEKDRETSLMKCRKLVNGGLNGYMRFLMLIQQLEAVAAKP